MTYGPDTRPIHDEQVALRRRRILAGINHYKQEFGYSPTVRELQQVAQVKSTSTVMLDLQWLRDHGMVTWTENVHRSFRVIED